MFGRRLRHCLINLAVKLTFKVVFDTSSGFFILMDVLASTRSLCLAILLLDGFDSIIGNIMSTTKEI